MQKEIRVKIWNDTGIPDAILEYCSAKKISVNDLARQAIAEKLSRMDVHSMTIAEIEAIERGDMYD